MGGTYLLAKPFIGTASEIVLRRLHRVRPMQYHRCPAVSTDHKAGILVLLIHVGAPAFVLPHPLDDVPGLPVDDGLMTALDYHALLAGMLHLTLVLVGLCAVLHVDRVADIEFILQHRRHGTLLPIIRLIQIQPHVGSAKPLVGVHSWTKHLFAFQDAGDLAGAVPRGTEGEDAAHHSGGLLVHAEFAFSIFILFIAVRRPRPQTLPALGLRPLHRPDLPAGVPHEPLVEQVLKGHQVVALGILRVHVVIDGDVAHPKLWEPFLDVETGMQLVAAQTAEIFGDDDPDLPILHVSHHALEVRPVEVSPGVSVIHIELWVGKAMVDSVLLQYSLLVLDTVGFPVQPVILTQAAVQGGDLHLV